LKTSCDETAIARFCAAVIYSPVKSHPRCALHEKYGGVPEVASRNHLLHAPGMLERIARNARIDISNIDALATSGPGLASSLMIGASIAKGFAIGFRRSSPGDSTISKDIFAVFRCLLKSNQLSRFDR
jgi:N6-L-threonylcarbamoyladenine synthase